MEALRVDPSRSPPVDVDARLANANQILEILPNLITISNHVYKEYETDEFSHLVASGASTIHVRHIKLAHFSVKEFLVSGMTEKCEAAPLLASTKLNQCFMTEACLYYILSYEESKHKAHSLTDLISFPLLVYACQYWPHHRASKDSLSLIPSRRA